ncbi:hypothetical protein BHF71_05880 [Vulcanibacillus modesticaldus]|uniref:TIGR04086 family membrane protein n=1 Tax=Vulcanibacillus modesticaldus TaxID=337097 RepID=A0A1D2YWS7_9BACI|nr:TIGR04086 family membrane protein [Vulcanibacillus modesticaldus]OEG00215.1 hypothetical protein BHF71_05880 [Vulcanibacillus modesticaldus]
MKHNQATNESKRTRPILTGLTYTIGIVIISSLIFAILLDFTSLSDTNLPLYSYTVTAISLLVGGFVAGKRAGNKGWYYGGITGLIYGVILAIVAFLALNIDFNLKNLVLIVLAFLFGAVGGIIGVNINK